MLSPVNNDLTGLVFETHRNKAELNDSLSKLSSGRRIVNPGEDSGSHSQVAKIGSKHKRDIANLQNLQNLVSYSQTQDGILSQVGEILHRMNELATRALDVTTNDGDRENYNKEFLELADQLEELKSETFNGVDLFGAGAFSAEKKQFVESLTNHWLKASEDQIKADYGWQTKPTDTWNLIVNEKDTNSNWAAFVVTSHYSDGTADVLEMQFDLPDFGSPHTQPVSTADRVVAHEMVHVMQAQNSYYADIVGDGSSSGTWFKEGLAEFIHGADSSVMSILASNGDDYAALNGAIGSGNEGWTTGEQYAAGYLAVKYLHERIKSSTEPGASTEGIKHMTQWMKSQFEDSTQNASQSGIDAYFTTFNIPKEGGGNFTGNTDFLNAFKGADGQAFVEDLNTQPTPTSKLANSDTGSIRGSDENPTDPSLDAQDVISDVTGAADSGYVEEQDNSSLTALIDGAGLTYDLQSVDTITISDITTYNLNSINSAVTTLGELEFLLENLADERSMIGANLSRLEKEIDNLNGKITQGELAVSRIEDTDVALESNRFATRQVRMQSSIAILAQAQKLNIGIQDLIRGIMIGQS